MATETHNFELVDLRKLSIQQRNAIDLLITGLPDQETADQVGVDRSTVTRWRLYHPAFQAELETQRAALWGNAKEKLRSLVSDAVDLLGDLMQSPGVNDPDRIRIALELEKLAKLGEGIFPRGATDPEEIIAREARADPLAAFTQPSEYEVRRRELELQARLNGLTVEELDSLLGEVRDRAEAEERARRKAAREAKRAAQPPEPANRPGRTSRAPTGRAGGLR
jgi:hypothetical protein